MSKNQITSLKQSEKIEQIESWIQLGRFSVAIEELSRIYKRKPPRESLYQLCNLARRAGAPLLASRFLAPLFRIDGVESSPTTIERAAYGACLSTLGANQEAEKIFAESKDKQHPDLLLQQSFNFIRLWNYKNAIPLLRSYIELSQISDYQRLIAKVNLLAAYLAEEKFASFSLEFNSCQKLAQQYKAHLLLANCLEMRAQKNLAQKKWEATEHDLKLAKQLTKDQDSVYAFYVKKWELFAWQDQNQVLSSPSQSEIFYKKFYQLKKDCRKKQYWEVERDCDFQLAIRDPNHTTLNKVYFGTPFDSYRKKIRRKIGKSIFIPDSWEYSNSASDAKLFAIDPLDLRKIPFRLFAALFRDLYKPLSVGLVQSLVFPDEVFIPDSTSRRINQLCVRVRQSLKRKDAQFDIHIFKHMYWVEIGKQQSIRLISPDTPLPTVFNSAEEILEKNILAGKWGQRFLFKDIQVNLPEYILRRVLKKCVENKTVKYMAQGPKSIYILAKDR